MKHVHHDADADRVNLPGLSTEAEGIQSALVGTRSTKAAAREDAFSYLASQGPDGMNALLQVVEQERAGRRAKRRWIKWIAGIYAGVLLLFVVAAVLINTQMVTFVSAFSSFSAVIGGLMVFTGRHRSAVRALSQFDDIRVTGAAIEALQMQDKEVKALASRALCRLLPRLRASDAGLLDADQRATLNKVLPRAARSQPDLALAMMVALRQVGDATAIPVLERLAKEGNSQFDSDPVAIAARETLPFVREHVAIEGSSRVLLRASAPDAIQSDQLPRPAQEIAPQEELLHITAPLTGPEP